MIKNLTISFKDFDNLLWSIDVPTDTEDLPYNLANVFAKIIKESNANEDIVLEELKDAL